MSKPNYQFIIVHEYYKDAVLSVMPGVYDSEDVALGIAAEYTELEHNHNGHRFMVAQVSSSSLRVKAKSR